MYWARTQGRFGGCSAAQQQPGVPNHGVECLFMSLIVKCSGRHHNRAH